MRTAYRLVVEQAELHRTDGTAHTDVPPRSIGERVVHQDVIPLSPPDVFDPGADQ